MSSTLNEYLFSFIVILHWALPEKKLYAAIQRNMFSAGLWSKEQFAHGNPAYFCSKRHPTEPFWLNRSIPYHFLCQIHPSRASTMPGNSQRKQSTGGPTLSDNTHPNHYSAGIVQDYLQYLLRWGHVFPIHRILQPWRTSTPISHSQWVYQPLG